MGILFQLLQYLNLHKVSKFEMKEDKYVLKKKELAKKYLYLYVNRMVYQ